MYISTCTHTHTLRKNSIILFSLLKFKCLWSNKLIVFDSKLPVDCPSWNILWASLIFKRFAFCLASHLSFFLFSRFLLEEKLEWGQARWFRGLRERGVFTQNSHSTSSEKPGWFLSYGSRWILSYCKISKLSAFWDGKLSKLDTRITSLAEKGKWSPSPSIIIRTLWGRSYNYSLKVSQLKRLQILMSLTIGHWWDLCHHRSFHLPIHFSPENAISLLQ